MNQLGNDLAFGNQVHHTEVRRAHEGFGEQCCEWSYAIDDDHRDIEKSGFDGGSAAGNDGSVGDGECVIGLTFDDAKI